MANARGLCHSCLDSLLPDLPLWGHASSNDIQKEFLVKHAAGNVLHWLDFIFSHLGSRKVD